MAKTISAVGYIRMSTDKQETSPEQQRSEIEKYAAKHGYSILRWYEDLGISGDRTEKRVGFQQMITDADDGRFKAIICWDQDRFGRFDSLESGYWIHPLRKRGVQLITVTDGPVDWSSFAGRMLYGMKQEGKHQYLVDLSNNVSRRMRQLAEQGLWFSGRPPFGYVLGEDRKLALASPEIVNAARSVFERYLAGDSTRQIAAMLNGKGIRSGSGKLWTATGISDLMKNPAYVGTFRYGLRNFGKYQRKAGSDRLRSDADMVVVENAHPAIVTHEIQERCIQQLAERKRRTAPVAGGAFALTGLLRCGHCGYGMHGDKANGTLNYLCFSYRQRPGECDRHAVHEADALATILKELKNRLFEANIVKRLRAEMRKQLTAPDDAQAAIDSQLAAIDTKIEAAEQRLVEVSKDMISRVEGQIRELMRQRSELIEQAKSQPAALTPEEVEDRIKAALEWFKKLEQVASADFDPQAMRTMLGEFIDKVELKFERVQWGKSGKRFKCNLVGGVIHFRLWGVVSSGGPLLDRIDIHIEVPAVPFQELSIGAPGISSDTMREQVIAARRHQSRRFTGSKNLYNAQMNSRQLRTHCPLDTTCRNQLRDAVEELGLSARAHDKVLRVARTIADLADSEEIELPHIQEAINYRMLDRRLLQ